MTLELYISNAEKVKVNKTSDIILLTTLEGTLRQNTDIQNPTIIIELNPIDEQFVVKGSTVDTMDDNGRDVVTSTNVDVVADYFSLIPSANYAHIKEFNRWYFITNKVTTGRNLWMLTLREDVLMSHRPYILELYALIARNEYDYNPMIEDTEISWRYDKTVYQYVPTNLSAVTSLTTTPSGNNVVISYLTIDALHTSGSTQALDSLPIISTYASGANISTQYLVCGTGSVHDFGDKVMRNDTLLSFIKNVMIYPFSIPYGTVASVAEITLGADTEKNKVVLTEEFKFPLKYPLRVVIAHFTMPQATSFLAFDPYTKYDFFIPYYGFTTLSSEVISGKELKVFYQVNYEDGTATAYIYNVTDNVVLFTAQCTLGIKVSLSSTNSLEINNQKNSLALNTGVNLVSSAIAVGGGVATGNVVASMGGLLRGASAIGTAITQYNQIYNLGHVGISQGSDGFSNRQQFYIRRTTAVPVAYDANWFKLNGRPLNEYRRLSTLTGYTRIGDCHMENMSVAMDGEITEIYNLLRSGVIL